MDANLVGFISLGALIVGLFAWLRQDIRELRKLMDRQINRVHDSLQEKINGVHDSLQDRINRLEAQVNELRERVARIEGLLEAVFMRRDLTPFPEPSPTGGQPDETRAA